MPLFALSNAGINLSGALATTSTSRLVVLGIVAGLVIGKPLGIAGAIAIVVKLRIVELPKEIGWRGVVVVGAVAGIGFTMAIFIAELALPGDGVLRAAKFAVLCASLLAATLAAMLGRILLRPR